MKSSMDHFAFSGILCLKSLIIQISTIKITKVFTCCKTQCLEMIKNTQEEIRMKLAYFSYQAGYLALDDYHEC